MQQPVCTGLFMELRVCSSQRLAEEIQLGLRDLILIDVRPAMQYSHKHILHAENLNLSKIVIRRLLKGVVSFKSMLQSTPSLLDKLGGSQRPRLVLCDLASSAESPQPDLLRHAEVLWYCCATGDHDSRCSDIYILDGGLTAFEALHPELCVAPTPSCRKRPNAISAAVSLSAQLPPTRLQFVRATPEIKEDDDERYGPPAEILPHVVLGCERDSSNLQVLQRLGITAVLNISHNCLNHFESVFEYMEIPVEDTYHSDLLSKLQTAFEFIEHVRGKGGRVFLHCYAGVSRSPTVCIAYLMQAHQWSLSQAYDYVKSRRPHISPNLHFMGQLVAFQKQLELERSERDIPRTVSSCVNSFYSPSHSPSFGRTQARCISAPSVYTTEGSKALDVCQCLPQTRILETCKKAANKGLIDHSPHKFPLTP